jgi:hypothetical protein
MLAGPYSKLERLARAMPLVTKRINDVVPSLTSMWLRRIRLTLVGEVANRDAIKKIVELFTPE